MSPPEIVPGPGEEEYVEKAARDAVGESEARALALQGIVELSRGIDIAAAEIRAGRFMQAAETLMLAKAGCVVAEAAIQRIRVEAARVEERERAEIAVHELTEAIRLTVEYVGTETLRPIPGWSWYDALVKYAPEVAARIARGEAT